METTAANQVVEGQKLLDALRSGQREALVRLYENCRAEYLAWAQRISPLDRDRLLDIYQDSVMVFYNNVRSGRLTSLDASAKTYFFAIAKNKIRQTTRFYSRFDADPDPEIVGLDHLDFTVHHKTEADDLRHRISAALARLGDPCKTLLRLSFWENFSAEAIARRLDYKDENVVNTLKNRCLQKLRGLVKT